MIDLGTSLVNKVWNNVEDEVMIDLRHVVWMNIRGIVRTSFGNVMDEVWSEVNRRVWDQIWDHLEEIDD
jgi:hypothetical protein